MTKPYRPAAHEPIGRVEKGPSESPTWLITAKLKELNCDGWIIGGKAKFVGFTGVSKVFPDA